MSTEELIEPIKTRRQGALELISSKKTKTSSNITTLKKKNKNG